MWLRVAVTTVVVVERETGHAVGRDAGDASLSGAGRRILVFEIVDGHFRGLAHALVDAVPGFGSERPEDADAFGWRVVRSKPATGASVVAFAHFDVLRYWPLTVGCAVR